MAKDIVTLNNPVGGPCLNRVLFFSFEVPGRKLSAKLVSQNIKRSLRDMYTQPNGKITLKDIEFLKNLPFDIVEVPLNVDKIFNTIDLYANKYPKARIHAIYDHTLLAENFSGDGDMDTLIHLANRANKEKKTYNLVQIFVSQLNDSLLRDDRMKRPSGNYPVQSDIFGSRAIWHVSDFVSCGVNPSRLNLPMKGGNVTYGIHKLPLTLPIKNSTEVKELIYWHNVKTRDASLSITPLINNLKYSTLTELSPAKLDVFRKKYGIEHFD